MRYVRVELNGRPQWGVVENGIVDLMDKAPFRGGHVTGDTLDLASAHLLAPAEPTKIVCVAHNFSQLAQDIGEPLPTEPLIFFKPPTCLIGPEAPIIYPAGVERVIFEGEMGLVIGRTMKKTPPEKTRSHLLGVTCFNDVTERAMIERDHHLLALGKGMDSFGPTGPWVDSEVDPNNLRLTTRLNGEIKQQADTSESIFSVEEILSFISRWVTLLPGDIVTCGTPAGIDTLVPGDRVEVELAGLGVLGNTVVDQGKI